MPGFDRRMFELLKPLGVDDAGRSELDGGDPVERDQQRAGRDAVRRSCRGCPTRATSWLALAMSSTLAGNLTILGSIANLIVVEGARRRGSRSGSSSTWRSAFR